MKVVLFVLAGSLLLAARTESLPLANDPPPPLSIPIYDSDHELLIDEHVHPDIVYRPNWNGSGFNYWMAITPFIYNDDQYENPSIAVSVDGIVWQEQPGMRNPIIGAPDSCQDWCYNNDPDLLFVGDSLVLYYNETHNTPETLTRVMRSISGDGVTWTTPAEVFRRTNFPLSPAVIYEPGPGDDYTMWFLQTTACGTGTLMRRTSEDGVNWPENAVSVDIANSPVVPWHLDVVKVGGKYVMLYVGGCNPMSLYQAESLDGLTWCALQTPVLQPGAPGLWDNPVIYRSTFLSSGNDSLRVWYSAYNPAIVFHAGYTSGPTGDCTPPAQITDLGSDCIGKTGLLLQWTSPGDDGGFGTATSYEVRYSQSPITESNFTSATLAPNPPAPEPAGTYHEMPINGLQACRSYYFAIRTSDGHGVSPISVFWARLRCSGIGTCSPGMSPVAVVPRHAGLSAPNPVTSVTSIKVAFTTEEEGERWDLSIHDVAGRLVRTLGSGTASVGELDIAWDVRGDDGRRLGEGVYYARLRVGGTVHNRTMVVMR